MISILSDNLLLKNQCLMLAAHSVYGYLPNYDKKGYLLGLTSPSTSPLIYFIDRVNNLNMAQLTEFLKSKPALLAQFKAERAKITMIDWDRKKLEVSIKYLKLFLGEKK